MWIQSVIFMFCFLCSLANLVANIQEYLQYRYIVTPRMVSVDDVILPAVSICTSNFFDHDRVRRQQPELLTEFNNQDLNERAAKPFLLDRLNFSQLINFSYTYDQIVQSCTLYDPDMNVVSCESLGPVRQWYSFESLCFQFFNNRNSSNDSKFIYRREDLVELQWLTITLYKPVFQKRHVGLLVSRPGITLEPFYTNPAFIKASVITTHTLVVTYRKVTTERLPAPYRSDCINYSQVYAGRLVSQTNCSLDCLSTQLQLQQKFPEFLLSELQPHKLGLHFTHNYSHLLRDCQQTCKHPDCYGEDFELIVKYEKLTAQAEDTFRVRIVYNYEPEKQILYQPILTRVQLISILSFLISPLAFWLGASFFNVNCWCINAAAHLCQIYRTLQRKRQLRSVDGGK